MLLVVSLLTTCTCRRSYEVPSPQTNNPIYLHSVPITPMSPHPIIVLEVQFNNSSTQKFFPLPPSPLLKVHLHEIFLFSFFALIEQL